MPPFHVATDSAHRAHHVLDDVGAGERASKFGGQSETGDGENLVQALQDAGADAGRIAFEALREIAHQFLGFVSIVQFPGLAQHTPDRACNGFGSRSMILRALWI